jgi:hypothetical protein
VTEKLHYLNKHRRKLGSPADDFLNLLLGKFTCKDVYIYPIYVNFVEKFGDTTTGTIGSWGNHFAGSSYLATFLDSYTGS